MSEALQERGRRLGGEPWLRILQALVLLLVLVTGVARVTVARPAALVTLGISDIRAASSVAKAQQSARFDYVQTISVSGQNASFTMDGEIDFAASRSRVVLDLGDAGKALGIGEVEFVSSGSTIWVRLPAAKSALTGKGWVSVTLEPGTAVSNDPTKQLDYLADLGGVPERLGTAEVRGVTTGHYRTSLQAERVLAAMPKELQALTRSGMAAAGLSEIPIETWIDADGLPRRIETTLSMADAQSVGRMELFDYGVPVSITVPGAAETTRVATLASLYVAAGFPAGILG